MTKPGRTDRLTCPTMRESLQEDGSLLAMGAHDGLLARIAARAGFKALYHGSYAVSSTYGEPDIGLIGLAESTGGVRRVAGAVDVPVIADADTGYGEEGAVWRTVREFERAGASAIQIEDQVFPKRCGHMDGKAVIDRERAVSKIRTACAARRDPETVIIARTDSLQAHGMDEAIDRCNMFAEVGADIVFIDAPESREQMEAAAQRVDAPAMVNTTETGRTPLLSVAELEELGFKLIIFPSNQLWTLAGAYQELCRAVLDQGSTAAVRDRMMPFAEVNELLRLSDYQALEP